MERGGFAEAKPYPWQTDTAQPRNSWCYTDTLIYKTSQEIICTLVDVVSKNGNLLLNVGPKADGTLPEGDKKILRDLADIDRQVHSVGIRNQKAQHRLSCSYLRLALDCVKAQLFIELELKALLPVQEQTSNFTMTM